jgi:hypothetical protein
MNETTGREREREREREMKFDFIHLLVVIRTKNENVISSIVDYRRWMNREMNYAQI